LLQTQVQKLMELILIALEVVKATIGLNTESLL